MIKRNSVSLGVILGILGPIIGFWLYYLLTYHNFNHLEFLKKVFEMGISSAVLSLCLLTNLAIFFFFIWKKFDFSAKGVLAATIVYAIIGFLLKYFF